MKFYFPFISAVCFPVAPAVLLSVAWHAETIDKALPRSEGLQSLRVEERRRPLLARAASVGVGERGQRLQSAPPGEPALRRGAGVCAGSWARRVSGSARGVGSTFCSGGLCFHQIMVCREL